MTQSRKTKEALEVIKGDVSGRAAGPGGVTVWFTGLSGAGKTTIAKLVEEKLKELGVPVERLDGDTVRQSLTRDLGFSKEDRYTNLERVSFVAKLLTRNGVIVLASFIAPYREAREMCRRTIGSFLEVYVKAELATLISRDTKGLYMKALAGELTNFTGINDPYEEPENPDLICDTDAEKPEESAAKVLNLLVERGFLSSPASPPVQPVAARSLPARPLSAKPSSALPEAASPCPGPSIPHGGVLIDRMLTGEALAEAKVRVAHLPKVYLTQQQESDLEMIATGAYSPLTGFMEQSAYLSVVEEMRLPDGLLWSLPITLAVDKETASALTLGKEIALCRSDGRALAIMQVNEIFTYDKGREARLVYGTEDTAHPGVAALFRQGELLLGGPIWLLERPGVDPLFAKYYHTPLELRRIFQSRGWRSVVAFQTRNPVHRAHEYLQKCALEMLDGLLLHPLIGATKADDVPAATRLLAYEAVLQHYYPSERVQLSLFPAAMRYAGPREAVFHAICRKNYGCTHFIVGRDHAGVGNYYGTYAAQELISSFSPAELGIIPLLFENAFYCRICGGMATPKTCPHEERFHISLSGTKVRRLLEEGQTPPPECTRPEVAQVLLGNCQAAPQS
ncbi:MAG TPA: sulfate adenylyltransferase [Firmicutes bacterium]|nr:sulfate adenylyltransferase [Bacillota bacterium]